MKALKSYEHTQVAFEETDALILGKAVHMACLEPELFLKKAVVAPKLDKRTKQGKLDYDAFLAQHQGTDTLILTDEQMNTITRMSERFDSLISDNDDLNQALAGAKTEQSLFWDSGDMLCKCRFDAVNISLDQPIIVDLKSTKDAHPDAFKWSFKNFHYDLQAEWYRWGLSQILEPNHKPIKYLIVAIEKEPPYAGAVYEINYAHPQFKGITKVQVALENYLNKYSSYKPQSTWELY
jgi:hypothetical protein